MCKIVIQENAVTMHLTKNVGYLCFEYVLHHHHVYLAISEGNLQSCKVGDVISRFGFGAGHRKATERPHGGSHVSLRHQTRQLHMCRHQGLCAVTETLTSEEVQLSLLAGMILLGTATAPPRNIV